MDETAVAVVGAGYQVDITRYSFLDPALALRSARSVAIR
jgi:hypothetical protein